MKKKDKYKIISSTNHHEVTYYVNKYLKKGYELHGELKITKNDSSTMIYTQVLVLHEE